MLTICRTLSAHALEALKEFYQDRDARQEQFEKLKNKAEDDAAVSSSLTMDTFAEDWNASQFWVRFVLLVFCVYSSRDLIADNTLSIPKRLQHF